VESAANFCAAKAVLHVQISPQPTRYLYSNGADNHPHVATAALKDPQYPQRFLIDNPHFAFLVLMVFEDLVDRGIRFVFGPA